MALDVRLHRADGAPWGFRLVGGAEYDLPLTIAKVELGSAAERAGLQDGDELLSIGGVCTSLLTHVGAHGAITTAGDTLHLAVVRRTNSSSHMQAPPGHDQIPFIDIVPPSQPPEVPSPPRTLASSPFMHPLKPYRPFSAEPQEGIPPLENPIILSPNYHDVFKKKPKDFESPSKFKLEVSKDYLPEGEDADERDVMESYSKMQVADMTPMEELNKEIDLEQIENTAAFIVDESLSKAVTVSEEIKQEIGYELMTHTSETKTTSDMARITSGVSSEDKKLSVSLLAQLIDQTADEISKSNLMVYSEILDKNTTDVSTNIKTYESLTESSKTQTMISQHSEEKGTVKTEVNECDDIFEKQLISTAHKITDESCETTFSGDSKFQEYSFNNQESSELMQGVRSSIDLNQEKTETLKQNSRLVVNTEAMIESTEDKQSTKETNISEHAEAKIESTESKQMSTQKENSQTKAESKMLSTESGKITEKTTESLTSIKQRAISTANLLAEQRAFTLGLQTIPNIQGHVHSSYHYDLLLKTFFIHLTDVMVALSRIILAEGGSRSVSPMPPHRDDGLKQHISQQVFSQNNVENQCRNEKRVSSEQSQEIVEDSFNRTSASKFSQLSSLKTAEMTEKMDAVITEFKKDVGEQIKTQDVVNDSRNIRSKSVSKIEEEVSKERDPLEWLAKIDQSKTSGTIDTTSETHMSSLQEETETLSETKNKIIYVATVESHQVSAIEEVLDSAVNIASSTEISLKTNTSTEIEANETEQYIETNNVVQSQEKIEKSSLESECSTKYELDSMTQESNHTSTIQSKSSEETNISLHTLESTQSVALQSRTEACQESATVPLQISNEQISETPQIIPVNTQPGTRKSSLKTEINGYPESEPVRKPQLDTQISVASDDSSNTIVPQTPLTDEYVFRLQIRVRDLDESKAPEREPTPPETHEDPATAFKPKLIPHIDTCIEPVRYFVDPQNKLESPGTEGNNAFPDTKLHERASIIEPFIGSAPPANVIGKTAPYINAIEKIADPQRETIGETVPHGTTLDITAQPSLPTFENNAPPFPVAHEFANKMASNAYNIASIDSFATNIGTSASELTHGARRSSGTLVEEYIGQDIIAEECRRATLLTSAIDNTIQDIERYKQEFGVDTPRPIATQNGGPVQNGGSFMLNGTSMTNGVNGYVNGFNGNGINYSVEHLGGTTQGIVDALENGGIIDENVAKELGKPGLTDDKIAALISGESEMLKEAHVIGVDFKKIKPQIDALRDSQVLKALNDELTRSEEEKKREERKWTTFLQRPHRAVPRARFGHITEPEYPQEPYKIKIVKQPKPKVAPDYKPEDFETGPLPWELRAATEPPPPPAQREEPVLVPETCPLYLEALDNLPESEVPDLEDTGIPLPAEGPETADAPEAAPESPSPDALASEEPPEPEQAAEEGPEAQAEDTEQNMMAEQILGNIQSMVDPNATMEEQLVQMRAQLAALAQLPGVISSTLQLVTEQLGQLTRTQEIKEEVQHSETTVTEIREEVTTTEKTTAEVTESTSVATEVTEIAEGTEGAEISEKATELAEKSEGTVACEASPPRVAEAQEAREVRGNENGSIDDQSRFEKQKKDLMAELHQEHGQRQVKQRAPRPGGRPQPAFGPLVPSERPLVLPGGRRWRSERDAFNEDFIRETLTAQAEIIQGKTKGVNFMKWEKPAKSLDYLKESDVYKLVHNMDGVPSRGCDQLRTVALAESDYREWEEPAKLLDYLKDSDVYKLVHNMDGAPSRGCDQLRRIALAESDYTEDLNSNTQDSSRFYKVIQENGAPNTRSVEAFSPQIPQHTASFPQRAAAASKNTPCAAQTCTELMLYVPPNLPQMATELPPLSAGLAIQGNAAPNPDRVQTFPPQLPQNTGSLPPRTVAASQNIAFPSSACTEVVWPPYRPQMAAELPPRPASRSYGTYQENIAPNPRRVQTFPPQLPEYTGSPPLRAAAAPQKAPCHPKACAGLVLPPNLPQTAAELPPRPASRAEALEIVSNYVGTHADSARTTPASH